MTTNLVKPWERFVFQETNGTSTHLKTGLRTIYLGTDITAPSLHPGHLVPLLFLKKLREAGHKIIIILGGTTSLIGDPTGRDSQRLALTPADIQQNIDRIRDCISLVLGPETLILNNADWLTDIKWIDMIREIGSKISVNKLIKTDTFECRLQNNQPLSFLEICYPLCQAYDFMHLNKQYGCTIQCGASDQWANILTGTHLIDGMFGITCPLLTDHQGRKISKTTHQTVWLHPSLNTAFELWQFFKNLPDHSAQQLLAMLPELSNEDINTSKTSLAEYLTALVHGNQEARKASQQAQAIFVTGNLDALPILTLPNNSYLLHELVSATKIAETKSKARQLIRQNAVKIDNQQVVNEATTINLPCTITIGKKGYRLQNDKPTNS